MATKYLKGNREYHTVVDDADTTACGFKYKDAGRDNQLEAVKSQPGWPTHAACAHGLKISQVDSHKK
jgi:hypothetical protein